MQDRATGARLSGQKTRVKALWRAAKRDAQSIRATADGLEVAEAVLEKIKALATP